VSATDFFEKRALCPVFASCFSILFLSALEATADAGFSNSCATKIRSTTTKIRLNDYRKAVNDYKNTV